MSISSTVVACIFFSFIAMCLGSIGGSRPGQQSGPYSLGSQQKTIDKIQKDFGHTDDESLEQFLQVYHEKNIDGPGVSTMRKWWIHYCDYNELPIRTKRKLDRLAKKKWFSNQVHKEVVAFLYRTPTSTSIR